MCRADKCREAFAQSQGMILFGSKIKLTQMELEGTFVHAVNLQGVCKEISVHTGWPSEIFL